MPKRCVRCQSDSVESSFGAQVSGVEKKLWCEKVWCEIVTKFFV